MGGNFLPHPFYVEGSLHTAYSIVSRESYRGFVAAKARAKAMK